MGFLPLHLAYPFAGMRAAGVLADSWVTQYAVMIGSAIEIPLLMYILHCRARDFSENRTRMRTIDSTDPLTGLTLAPVLIPRLGDAMRRPRSNDSNDSNCGLALVELANHGELVAQEGRQAGDRALVTAGSQLTALVRDVDTVCRAAENRFAILLEGPYNTELLKPLAQHIVATGLARLPYHQSLRYRVATLALPDWSSQNAKAQELDARRMLARLNRVLDQLGPKRVIVHLPLPPRLNTGQRLTEAV